jgi:hypothetical protein
MKHPTEADFKVAASDAAVTVTFLPTKSTYTFYRLADAIDAAARRIVEIANGVEALQDGRIFIERRLSLLAAAASNSALGSSAP